MPIRVSGNKVGNSAHAHWWDHIAPAFSADYNVAAINLYGMGDSDHLDTYSLEILVESVLGVVEVWSKHRQPPALVGHSFGGRLCLKAKLSAPDLVGSLFLVDVPFYPPGHSFEWANKAISTRPSRHYTTLAEAVSRFRLSPDQPCQNPNIISHIANNSFHKQPQEWVLKADPALFAQLDYLSLVNDLPSEVLNLKGYIRGANSLLYTPELTDFNTSILQNVPSITVHSAGHHVFLDEPEAFVSALLELLHSC